MLFFSSVNVQLSHAQSATNANEGVLYKYDLKYEGANVHIDGNYLYILENFVLFLKNNPGVNIHIRGHVCCGPDKKISRRRARKVYRFLKQQGIDKTRMTHAGYGDRVPLAYPEKTDEDERVNRRVDFVLKYPLQ